MSGTQDVLNLPYPEMGNFNQEELARAVSMNFQEVTRYVSSLQLLIKGITGGTVSDFTDVAETWNQAVENAAQAISDAATAQGTADGKVTTYFDVPSWKYLINQLSADYVRYYLYGGQYTAQSFIPIGNIVGADNVKVSLLSGGKTWRSIDTHWHIYADNAGEPGTSISTTGYGIITGENWPESTDEWIDVEIETDTPLVAGTTYWIVVQGQGSGSDYYYVKYSTNSNVYAGGVWSRSDNAGATWSAQSNYDMTFKVGCLTLDVDDMSEGDLWFDTSDGNKGYRYDETDGKWVEVRDTGIVQAISDASTAQATADGKIVTYYQDTEPTGEELTIGDLWVDTNDYNKLYRYDGTAWQSAKDGNFPDATVISNKTAGGISDAIDGFGTGSDGAFNSVDDVTFSIESDDTYSVIKQYSSFTLNTGHTLTVDKRCRGLFILVRGDVEISGTIDMSGKGGKVSRDMSVQRTLQIPIGVTLIDIPPGGTGGNGGSGGAGGDAIYDPATPGSGGAGRTGSVATWFSGGFGAPGGGGGSGAAGYNSSYYNNGYNGGAAGTADLDVAVGSGGVAGGTAAAGGIGGNLSGGGGAGRALASISNYSGAGGGGAGINGGYAGTGANGATTGDSGGGLSGGLICIIAKGNITINSGAYVKANGTDGGDGGTGGDAPEERCGGGGGGGGQGGGGGGVAVSAYGGSYTNNGTIQVNGGSAGSGGIGGAAGGESGTTAGANGTNGTNGSVGTIVLVAL